MTTPRLRRTLFTAFGLSGAMMAGSTPRSCSAQAAPVAVQASPWLAPDKALRSTMDTGKPTLVVVTSQTSPASAQLLRSLRQATATQAFGKIANLCELNAEQSPNEVKQLGVESYPTVVAYRRGAQGLEFAGKRGGISDAGTLLEWVQPQGLFAAPAADRAVVAASYQDGQASPQNNPPAASPPAAYVPTQAPPVQYAPPPAAYAPAPVAAYAPAPMAAYAPASAPVVIHQQPTTLIMAPTPPPNIMHMAPAANLFAAPPAAYAPPPVAYAPPPAAYAPAPAAYAPVAYAPAPAAYAPVPMAAYGPAPAALGGGSAIILRGPGPIRSALGAFGRGLANLSNPTVQMNTSASFATMQIPVGQPAQYAPAPQYAPPAQYAPAPSPQSAPCSRKFCRLLHHHDSE